MDRTFEFKMTESQADIVVRALSEFPYKLTKDLIPSLQMQYQEQKSSPGGNGHPQIESRAEKVTN